MPETVIQNTNFTAGELSPRLLGRPDIQRYYNAAKRLSNFIVLQQGGVTKRPGSVFVREVKDSSKKVRNIGFEFNTEQAYNLEFGDQYMRVYRNGGIVREQVAITGATAANPVVITATAHGLTTGDLVDISDVGGMVELNGNSYFITVVDPNSFSLDGEDGTAYTTYTSGGLVTGPDPFELATPYLEAELFELKKAQSADTLFVVHPSHKPRKITRTAHGIWTIANYAPTADPFTSDDNYPSTVTFFEQRIIFAATNTDPAKVFLSKSADFDDMTAGTADDSAFTFVLASGRVNRIRWISGGSGQLLIGTAGDEYTETSSANDPLTPASISIRPQTNYGSADLEPIIAQNRTLFVQRSGKRVREFAFVFENDAFQAPDLTLLSEHLFGHADGGFGSNNVSKTIVQMAYMREPIPALLAVTSDGALHILTYEREQNIAGWSSHFDDDTSFVESVAVIPGSGGDEVWLSIRRTIDGATKRYIEYLNLGWTQVEDAFYVDSGLTYDGVLTSSLTGLDHLEGETVTVLGDGAVQPTREVSGGAITLETAVMKAHVGLAYTATLEPLPAAIQGQGLLGRALGWGRIRALLHNTVGLKINGETITFRKTSDPMSDHVPLFSGVVEKTNLGWGSDQDNTLSFVSDQPLPCTILMLSATVSVSDE